MVKTARTKMGRLCTNIVQDRLCSAFPRHLHHYCSGVRIICGHLGHRITAPMKYVVKFFSEIAIKSKPVRRRFVVRLHENLKAVLTEIDPEIKISRGWDKLQVQTAVEDETQLARLVEAMRNTSGISYILEVVEFPLPDFDGIVDRVLPVYAERLAGKTFAVRCKRHGDHAFTSVQVERAVGSALLAHSGAAGVKLKNPEVRVELEISKETLFVICERHKIGRAHV